MASAKLLLDDDGGCADADALDATDAKDVVTGVVEGEEAPHKSPN